MIYLSEIPRYRNVVMERICKCGAIIDLIRPENQPNMKASDMVYRHIFPYDYIVDETTEVGTYLCFDVAAPRIIDRTFSDFRIYFWIIPHERAMRTPKELITDLLSCEVDKLMDGSREFGLDRVEFMRWDRFTPADDFHGRSLTYRTVDSNRE